MNKVLLTYEYAGSATLRSVGAEFESENFIWINVFAIKIYHQSIE